MDVYEIDNKKDTFNNVLNTLLKTLPEKQNTLESRIVKIDNSLNLLNDKQIVLENKTKKHEDIIYELQKKQDAIYQGLVELTQMIAQYGEEYGESDNENEDDDIVDKVEQPEQADKSECNTP